MTRKAAGVVDGIPTEVTSILFADKILVTIAQEGRLAQWVKCLPTCRGSNRRVVNGK